MEEILTELLSMSVDIPASHYKDGYIEELTLILENIDLIKESVNDYVAWMIHEANRRKRLPFNRTHNHYIEYQNGKIAANRIFGLIVNISGYVT